jgi:hypothetical protein
MASLIFAASYLTYNKIKTKHEKRKEKKRKAYADRYQELEQEHRKDAEKQLQQQRTGDSNQEVEPLNSPIQSAELGVRRRSSESVRSDGGKVDGPGAWVDEVLRERSRDGIHSP